MRLIKLLAYSLLGYALYEMWCGMREGGSTASGFRGSRQSRSSGRSRDLHRALNEDPGRMMNMTGPGRGTSITTEDSDGTSVRHVVGRGVTHT